MMRACTIALVAALLPFVVPASAQPLSGVPAAFSETTISARSASMGSALTSLATGVESVSSNPGGAAFGPSFEAGFRHADVISLVRESQAVMSFASTRFGLVLGARSGGDETLREMTATATLGVRFDRVGLGLTAKARRATFGRNRIDPSDLVVFDPDEIADGLGRQVTGDATGAGLDVGLQVDLGAGMRFGVIARDVVAPVRWQSRAAAAAAGGSYREDIPPEVVLGLSAQVSGSGILAADVRPATGRDQEPMLRVGAQWSPIGMMHLRVGTERILAQGTEARWSAGFGLELPRLLGAALVADYAYVSGTLGATQAVSISLRVP